MQKMKNYIPQRYLVTYRINDRNYPQQMATLETDSRTIEADFNTDLDSRFFWEDREVLEYHRIETPKDQKIPWLEDYYQNEHQYIVGMDDLQKKMSN